MINCLHISKEIINNQLKTCFDSKNKQLNYEPYLETLLDVPGDLTDLKIEINNKFVDSSVYDYTSDYLKYPLSSEDNGEPLNYFKRPETSRFMTWKMFYPDKVLHITGMTHIGKTYEVLRFCDSIDTPTIYINLKDDLVFITLLSKYLTQSIESVTEEDINYNYIDTTVDSCATPELIDFKSLFIDYIDKLLTNPWVSSSKLINYSKDLKSFTGLLVLDNVHILKNYWGVIENIKRQLDFKIIITSSEKTYIPNKNQVDFIRNNVYNLKLNPIPFKIFQIYAQQCYETDINLQNLYKIYNLIGGIPEVINVFLTTHKFSECLNTLHIIIQDIFHNLNMHFNTELYYKKEAIRKNLATIYNTQYNTSEIRDVYNVRGWLYHADVLNICPVINCNRLTTDKIQYFISDLGLLSCLNLILQINPSNFKGIRAENFVYNSLSYELSKLGSNFINTPCKVVDISAELDFVIVHKETKSLIGIEVKSNKGSCITLTKLVNSGIINYAFCLDMRKEIISDENGIIHCPLYLTDIFINQIANLFQ